jgi:hypothetical protein
MRSQRTLRRTGLAAALVVALATAEPPGETPATRTVALDVFQTTAHEVSELRRDGARPVCRLRTAVWEPHRPDAGRFPDSVLGKRHGLFGDRWLDITRWDSLAPVLSDRLRLCRDKGFDWVRFDEDWGDPGGVDLTAADWDRFGARVGALAAGHGLTIDSARPATAPV